MRRKGLTFDRAAIPAWVVGAFGIAIVWATWGGGAAAIFGVGVLIGSFRLNGL